MEEKMVKIPAGSKLKLEALVDYIGYYLSETVENLTDFDVMHLASNMMRELDIRTKGVWAVSEEELKNFIIPP